MKKDPLANYVKVRLEDFNKAHLMWDRLYNNGDYFPHHFESFIGSRETRTYEYDLDTHTSSLLLSQRAADKVAMLCSPHARTLMQAFIIRTGYHKKLPK